MAVDELAPHGDESVESLMNDELCLAGLGHGYAPEPFGTWTKTRCQG